jgi:KAP family P-loop domain
MSSGALGPQASTSATSWLPGVHPAVSPAALAELRVTLNEIRAEWRASIDRTWPDESPTGWDEILGEGPPDEHDTTAPPSARVHADRWTTEDRLDYALYAKATAEFLQHKDATPPMVISVQAPWGQGKTSLMRMVQHNLDPDHPDFRRPDWRKSSAVESPSELTLGELRDSLDGKPVHERGHCTFAERPGLRDA